MPVDSASAVYADAACTQPLMPVPREAAGCPAVAPLPFLIEYAVTSCGRPRGAKISERGAPISLTSYYEGSPADCRGPFEAADQDFYAPGAALPIAQFAEVTTSEPRHGGRLRLRYWESADGLQRRSAVYDQQLETDCYLAFGSLRDPGRPTMCIPHGSPSTPYFSDRACTTPALVNTEDCPVPRFMTEASSCPDEPPVVHQVGPGITSPLYELTDTTCTESGDAEGAPRHPSAGIASLQGIPGAHVDAGRIKTTAFAIDADHVVKASALYDSRYEINCNPRQTRDGQLRCEPIGDSVRTMFTDAACTSPVKMIMVFRAPTCSNAEVRSLGVEYVSTPGTCGPTLSLHRPGAPTTSPRYVQRGACELFDDPSIQLYDTIGTVPLEELSTGQRMIDP